MSDLAYRDRNVLLFSDKRQREKIGAIELYTRQQGSSEFKFYIRDKKLIGEYIHKGDIQQLLISGIPDDFQTDLNEEKITKIKTMFEQCYFSVQRGKISVNARGLGGWGENVHRHGTHIWATNVGFTLKQAQIIAEACNNVDSGSTSPDPTTNSGGWEAATSRMVQQWHFNTNYSNQPDFSIGDSRVILAVSCMERAINLWKLKQSESKRQHSTGFYIGRELVLPNYDYGTTKAMEEWDREFAEKQMAKQIEICKLLGIGLHPLQDMFAHTGAFVSIIPGTSIQHHILNPGADDVSVELTRIEATEIATKFYLAIYSYNIGNCDDSIFTSIARDMNKHNTSQFWGLIQALQRQGIKCPISWNATNKQVQTQYAQSTASRCLLM